MCSTTTVDSFCFECSSTGECLQEVDKTDFISNFQSLGAPPCSLIQIADANPRTTGNVDIEAYSCSVVCPKSTYAHYDGKSYPRC